MSLEGAMGDLLIVLKDLRDRVEALEKKNVHDPVVYEITLEDGSKRVYRLER